LAKTQFSKYPWITTDRELSQAKNTENAMAKKQKYSKFLKIFTKAGQEST
jgi:hypothetical protein